MAVEAIVLKSPGVIVLICQSVPALLRPIRYKPVLLFIQLTPENPPQLKVCAPFDPPMPGILARVSRIEPVFASNQATPVPVELVRP